MHSLLFYRELINNKKLEILNWNDGGYENFEYNGIYLTKDLI